MVQGNSKLQKKTKARVTKTQKNPRKAAPKILKAKNKSITERLTKAQNSSISTNTEKLIASRVGHLELIKGSRRELEKKMKAKKK